MSYPANSCPSQHPARRGVEPSSTPQTFSSQLPSITVWFRKCHDVHKSDKAALPKRVRTQLVGLDSPKPTNSTNAGTGQQPPSHFSHHHQVTNHHHLLGDAKNKLCKGTRADSLSTPLIQLVPPLACFCPDLFQHCTERGRVKPTGTTPTTRTATLTRLITQ